MPISILAVLKVGMIPGYKDYTPPDLPFNKSIMDQSNGHSQQRPKVDNVASGGVLQESTKATPEIAPRKKWERRETS